MALGCPHLHQKAALQESLLNILRVPLLAIVQATDPIVVKGVVVIDPVSDFGPGAEEMKWRKSNQGSG